MKKFETTQQKIERFKEENKTVGRKAPIENRLLCCKNCNRAIDHEPNEFGLWNCTECGTTREDIKNKLKWRTRW